MHFSSLLVGVIYFLCNILIIHSWTTEDLELFDLVESTSQNFYDVLGVDEKASASDIRKAYRQLSTIYHPDKNKNLNAEDTFRKIAAVADVLRNEERRRMYDLILQTGLPDWKMPVYYYRHVRNMGLLELAIFLFSLATLAQYLFAWSVYWEKKYEFEEIVLSKLRKKVKHQRKGKNAKLEEDIVSQETCDSLKPRCQDLFPIQLFYFLMHLIKSSPSYFETCKSYLKDNNRNIEDIQEEKIERRVKLKKQDKPLIPDYSCKSNYKKNVDISIPEYREEIPQVAIKKWVFEELSAVDLCELKKALKRYPNGTLQRWEKVSECLNCSVSEVVLMVKQLKNQTMKNIPIAMQGVTGMEKENHGHELYKEKGGTPKEAYKTTNGETANSEKCWKQEEQRNLELALQKYPKVTPARWEKIAEYVITKNKEECIERYKLLAQQVKTKKDKGTS